MTEITGMRTGASPLMQWGVLSQCLQCWLHKSPGKSAGAPHWCSRCLHSSSPLLKSYWALLILVCDIPWPGHSSLCKIINAVSFQITSDSNVIHHPMCHLYHLYCFAVSYHVSLYWLPVEIQASLQVPFCPPSPGHSRAISPTQLSARSHQRVTAVVVGTAFASGI